MLTFHIEPLRKYYPAVSHCSSIHVLCINHFPQVIPTPIPRAGLPDRFCRQPQLQFFIFSSLHSKGETDKMTFTKSNANWEVRIK